MGIIEDLIGLDPSTITVTRHTRAGDGAGGYTYTTADLDPVVVRIYNFVIRNQHEWLSPEGEVKEVVMGILAPASTDFVVGHDSYDTFMWQGRTYRIVGVRNYTDVNLPEHIQADCVAI